MLSNNYDIAQLERETIQLRIKDNYMPGRERNVFGRKDLRMAMIKLKIKLNGNNTCSYKTNPGQAEVARMLFSRYADTETLLDSLSNALTKWASKQIRATAGAAYRSADL
jgi:hypothetical protein